jgi:hypothetical protein
VGYAVSSMRYRSASTTATTASPTSFVSGTGCTWTRVLASSLSTT